MSLWFVTENLAKEEKKTFLSRYLRYGTGKEKKNLLSECRQKNWEIFFNLIWCLFMLSGKKCVTFQHWFGENVFKGERFSMPNFGSPKPILMCVKNFHAWDGKQYFFSLFCQFLWANVWFLLAHVLICYALDAVLFGWENRKATDTICI